MFDNNTHAAHFEKMEKTVEKLCRSLREESHLWVFETYTFYKKSFFSRVEYWSGSKDHYNEPITSTWKETSHQVFSIEQGKRVREAYKAARLAQSTYSQKQVIASLK